MNPTIARRALWVVAVLALAYSVFAFWAWRPTELLIAFGVFIICIPFDIDLAHEERVRRGTTPFGPAAKWGISEDAIHERRQPPTYVSCNLPRPRPSLWRRVTPWWVWPAVLFTAVTGIGLCTAPAGHADDLQDYGFLHTLNLFDVRYSSETVAIALGHSACDSLTTGMSVRRVEIAIMHGGDYTPNDAATILGAAIGAYCDQHTHLISTTPTTRISAGIGGVPR